MPANAKLQADSKPGKQAEDNPKDNELKDKAKNGKLREKIFVARESVLTEMYKTDHIQTLYNVFVVVLLIQFIHTVANGLVSGRWDLELDFIIWNFGNLKLGLTIWLSMIGTTVGVYLCFRCWGLRPHLFSPSSSLLRYWDYGWLSFLVLYQLSFLVLPAVVLVKWRLPPATALSVLCEQVRMLMKTHAFVRSNAPRVLSYKVHSEDSTGPCPGFSHFMYFLFCPTLVYRDTYPRTKEIRWGVVAKHILEVLAVVFLHCFILQRWIQPAYRNWGLYPASPQHKVELIFGSILPAILADVSGIYCFLHAWSNGAAELMRFADRMFYQDWWNAASYGVYFRKWNVIVHDWLYTYVYRDIHETLKPRGKFGPTMAVFITSAAVHEYIFAFAFGFFYPLMFFMFIGVGATLVFIPTDSFKGGNTFFLLVLLIGTGLFTSLYTMEIYARVNCVQTQENWLDVIIPRSWFCIPKYP